MEKYGQNNSLMELKTEETDENLSGKVQQAHSHNSATVGTAISKLTALIIHLPANLSATRGKINPGPYLHT